MWQVNRAHESKGRFGKDRGITDDKNHSSRIFFELHASCSIMFWYKFLESCSTTTALKRSLSREQNTGRDDEDGNTESGKSKILHGISGFGFFSRELWKLSPWWALLSQGEQTLVQYSESSYHQGVALSSVYCILRNCVIFHYVRFAWTGILSRYMTKS